MAITRVGRRALAPHTKMDPFLGPSVISSRRLQWNDVVVERFCDRDAQVGEGRYADHLIGMNLGDVLSLTQRREGKLTPISWDTGALTFTPAGQANEWQWRGIADRAHLWIPQQTLASAVLSLDGSVPLSSLVPQVQFRDPVIAGCIEGLLECAAEGVEDLLYRQTLISTIAIALVRRCGGAFRRDHNAPQLALKRARDFIQTNYSRNISLEDIGSASGMSAYHLARSFRRVTGLTLHGYVTALRVRRAKQLIGRDTPLSLVALECGFSSQSHLTRVFSRVVGVPPGAYRSLRGSRGARSRIVKGSTDF